MMNLLISLWDLLIKGILRYNFLLLMCENLSVTILPSNQCWGLLSFPVLLTSNVATNGIATQISDYYNPVRGNPDYASYAIDGDFSTNINEGRCSKTGRSFGAWWQVDLKRPFDINKVAITARDRNGKCCNVKHTWEILKVYFN